MWAAQHLIVHQGTRTDDRGLCGDPSNLGGSLTVLMMTEGIHAPPMECGGEQATIDSPSAVGKWGQKTRMQKCMWTD